MNGRFSTTWLDSHRVAVAPVPRESIVGIGHVIAEVDGILARLADPALVAELGLELPRGVLLWGPPGTGKTMIARYLAGRLGQDVAMYEFAADELSPDRMRGTVRTVAQRHARAVIYVDEIDVWGLRRDSEAHTPETRAVLVGALASLDGLSEAAGPLFVASTNRHPSQLDPALVRSGRIGIHIAFDTPDLEERQALFLAMVGSRPVAEPIDHARLARVTRGRTPADIRAMVDDGYGLAVAAGRRALSNEDMLAAARRAGSVMPDDATASPEVRRRCALHEAGHVAVAVALRGAGYVTSVMLLPTGGRTLMGDESAGHEWEGSDSVLDAMAVGYGGIASERLSLDGGASLGGKDDVETCTRLGLALADASVLPELPPVAIDEMGYTAPESLKAERGDAVARLLETARETATSIVASRLDEVAAFAAELDRAGELSGVELADALERCFGSGREAR